MCRGMEEGSTAELRQADVMKERPRLFLSINLKWDAELRSNEKYCGVSEYNKTKMI